MMTVRAENLLNEIINQVEIYLGLPEDLDTYNHFEGVFEMLMELEGELKKPSDESAQ